MRSFLPIKGPGGRALTTKEKGALAILAVTLILCVLTVVAGESAYAADQARNPVFDAVSIPSRLLGGGIVAFYAIVLVWSGLLYLKGERAVDLGNLYGRAAATLGVIVGVSGMLGLAQLTTAGSLGTLVGGALDHTLGSAVGIGMLFAMGLVGISLASQGSWAALRYGSASPGAATDHESSGPSNLAAFQEPLGAGALLRGAGEPPLPDDGDPSPEARSLAVTQAMEEIERSKGVTIVDIETGTPEETGEEVASIGECVDAAPEPDASTEEGEVQQGVREIADLMAQNSAGLAIEPEIEIEPEPEAAELDAPEEEEPEEEEGFAVVDASPPSPEEPVVDVAEEREDAPRFRYLEQQTPAEEAQADGGDFVRVTYEEEADSAEPEAADEAFESVESADPIEVAEPPVSYEPAVFTDTVELADPADVARAAEAAKAAETVETETVAEPEQEEDQEVEEEAVGDPYARPRFLDRLSKPEDGGAGLRDRPFASYDWRGRPLD